MQIQEAVTTVFKKYVTMSGRASRSEFWYFILFVFIVAFVCGILDSAIFGVDPVTHQSKGMLGAILQILILVPSICLNTRRLHDIDKSGWWQLINLIPIVGLIVFIVWASTKGTTGANRFGPDPLTGGVVA